VQIRNFIVFLQVLHYCSNIRVWGEVTEEAGGQGAGDAGDAGDAGGESLFFAYFLFPVPCSLFPMTNNSIFPISTFL
jgi:hypothetical protein